jgi:hypothetical protein
MQQDINLLRNDLALEQAINRAQQTLMENISSGLSKEVSDRAQQDIILGNEIDANRSDITDLQARLGNFNDRVTSAEEAISAETANRKAADRALIGDEGTDTQDSDTIWGAKKYADDAKGQAYKYTRDYVASYTEEQIFPEVTTQINSVRRELSNKADASYVDNSINTAITQEASDRSRQDQIIQGNLTNEISDREIQYQGIFNKYLELVGDLGVLGNRVNQLADNLTIVHEALHNLINTLKEPGVTLPLPSSYPNI